MREILLAPVLQTRSRSTSAIRLPAGLKILRSQLVLIGDRTFVEIEADFPAPDVNLDRFFRRPTLRERDAS